MQAPKDLVKISAKRFGNISSKRRIYYAEHIPSSTPDSAPHMFANIHKKKEEDIRNKSIDPKEPIRNMFQKLINDLNKSENPLEAPTASPNTPTARLPYKNLPPRLQLALRSTNDPHIKLNALLSHKDLLSINPKYVDDVLIEDLNIISAEDLYSSLSEDLVLQLVRFYVKHKDFDQVAKIVVQAVSKNYHNDISVLSLKINNQLNKDHDLKFGFFDTMKSIYKIVTDSGNPKLFKFHYNVLTEKGRVFGFNNLEIEYEDLLNIMKLDQIIDNYQSIEEIPSQIWETKYEYINLKLALKSIENNRLSEGMDTLNKFKLLGEDGVLYRFLKAGNKFPKSKDNKSPTSFEQHLLNAISENKGYVMTRIDTQILKKTITNFNVFNKIMENMEDGKSASKVKNTYLQKLLDMDSRSAVVNFITKNLVKAEQFETQNLARAVFATKNKKLLSGLSRSLPKEAKNELLSSLITRSSSTIGKSKEESVPERQFNEMKWILESVNYNIHDSSFRHFAKLMTKLPIESQKSIMLKLSGISCAEYIKFVEKGVPISSMLIPTLFKIGKVESGYWLSRIARHIAGSCSTEECLYIFNDLKEQDTKAFLALYNKTIGSFLYLKKFDICQELFRYFPSDQLQILTNEYMVKDGKDPIYFDAMRENPIEILKLETIKILQDESKNGYGKDLQRRLWILRGHKKFDEQMAELLLKRVVRKQRINGELKVTERMQWCIGLCDSYGVKKETIEKILFTD
ncbi:CAP-Gly domain-containing linker protein 1 [Wickerhamomyces ciferrii]|uniref:CAP-Gly domain-containing linker protein 1 n=1 Tax=Wickerhamomyces ciferrii (strain ATCC 14091 / BCRC 22168 / CBS 111 / JCM 3599 / NBRC 0793 / NRRL Y-1031 F-60-10) TaxID=1206466 RepID=K0KTB6_WICCF|nr:CAP-Gly domain-containing linker protein 1 [Wickerhamomyces ciferrii]CCH46406.1 CAP-Gly domain-containing linker protein 1 [Wickerhamomyces ciferrii]